MISGDFMTELELLFYITFGLIYGCAVERKNVSVNLKNGLWSVWVSVFFYMFYWGLFHQILKTICFRISWGEVFSFFWLAFKQIILGIY